MPIKLTSPTGKDIPLRPTRPNAGLHAFYRRKLFELVDQMNNSIDYWITAAYKANEPELKQLAADASPARALRDAMDKVARRWLRKFNKGAEKLAAQFADKAQSYSDATFKKILADAGFTVEFKQTAAMNDAYQAIIGEQVGLIKSIAQQNLTQVQTIVMQSVQNGRDLGALREELTKRFSVTKKRAALIARDQNNKATGTLNKARQLSLGITTGRWRHSSAGKEPRPSHVEAGNADGGKGELYDIAKGCLIDGEYIQPGEKINCRCTCQPVIPGFDDEDYEIISPFGTSSPKLSITAR